MTYRVKEIFRTLQGEGHHTGRPAVFVRFAGCNLWSGREADRSKGAGSCAAWCDTDFIGGEPLSAAAIVGRAAELWGPDRCHRWAVLTGGEPLLQVDGPLIDDFHKIDFRVQVETNGTRPVPVGVDWLTVSPKAGVMLLVTVGDELKLVFPQDGLDPADFAGLPFRRFVIQPRDGPNRDANTRAAIEYCFAHPAWCLGIQMHKYVGVP